jgi:hypothetical protein
MHFMGGFYLFCILIIALYWQQYSNLEDLHRKRIIILFLITSDVTPLNKVTRDECTTCD